MEKPCIILLGAPGSGKGTCAGVLCEVLGIPQIATGDLFRSNLKEMTDIGKIAKSYIDKGELVPDSVTADMLKERLGKADTINGFVLDGFPRNIAQAEILDNLLKDVGHKINAVLFMNVSDEEIIRRLTGRKVCSVCQSPYHTTFNPPAVADICDKCGGALITRDDDKLETIQKRLKVFHNLTYPLVDYYRNLGLLDEMLSRVSVDKIKDGVIIFAKEHNFLK